MTEKIKREECHVGIYPCCIEFENGKVIRNCYACIEKYAYDKGRADAFAELKSLLRCRNYRGCAAGKGCDGVCSIDSDICRSCENFGIPYSLLE